MLRRSSFAFGKRLAERPPVEVHSHAHRATSRQDDFGLIGKRRGESLSFGSCVGQQVSRTTYCCFLMGTPST